MKLKCAEKYKHPANMTGAGLAIGIGIGVAVDNLGAGIAVGIAMGVALNRKSHHKDQKDTTSTDTSSTSDHE